MLLGIGRERVAALGDGEPQARGGEQVLQGLARAHVHQHVARGGDGQAGARGRGHDAVDALFVTGAVQQLERDRRAVAP